MSMILQLDISGQPSRWVNLETAIIYYAKDLVAWELGDATRVVKGGHNRMTGKQSSITTAPIICVRGDGGKFQFRHPTLNNRDLFRRDRNICAYCGRQFSDSKLTRDHIQPSSRGGEDSWINCVSACASDNQKKDDRTPEEAGMELLYVPYTPSKSEHLILQNRKILGSQMDLLMNALHSKSRLKEQILSGEYKFNG